MQISGVEKLQGQMGHSNETILLQKAGRESGPKGFQENEGSSLGPGTDREEGKEHNHGWIFTGIKTTLQLTTQPREN